MFYLEDLIKQIAQFPSADVQKPSQKRGVSDKLLGEVSLELRKIWSIRKVKIEEHNTLAKVFNEKIHKIEESPDAEFVRQTRILELLKLEIELLDQLFWVVLKKEFQKEMSELESTSYGSISLYEDWTCGLSNNSEEEPGLFGGFGVVIMSAHSH